MADLSVLYSLVRPWVPGAPDPALELAAQHVVRDFCRRTRALQVWLDPIAVLGGTGTATLTPPVGYELVAPVLVRCDGKRLQPKTPDALDDGSPYEDWRTFVPAQPAVFVADALDPTVLTLHPIPASDATLNIKVAVRPTSPFTTISSSLLRWDTFLAAGIKAALFGMRETPFYSAELLPIEEARYADGVAQARLEILRGAVDAPAHVSMTPLA